MGMIEQLNAKLDAGEPAYIYKAIQPTFDWNTAVGYLTHCADVELGEPVEILTYKLPLADEVESIKPVKEWLSENISKTILGADMYVSLTTKNEVKYKGKNDVLLWNVIGTGKFTFHGVDRHLELGDLIYIPKNDEYIVKPESAQTFVLFSLE